MPAQDDAASLLDAIENPADLRKLDAAKLVQVSQELREFLIRKVASRGDHFEAGLGAVELTVALHYVFDTPHDRIVWDVGHQTYPHKMCIRDRCSKSATRSVASSGSLRLP